MKTLRPLVPILIAGTLVLTSCTPALGTSQTPSAGVSFSDVSSGYWAAAPIEALTAKGVFNGLPGGVFQPDSTLTRAQFAAALVRAFSLPPTATAPPFSDVPAGAWYGPDVAAAVAAGVVVPADYGANLNPNSPITRGEISQWLVAALQGKGFNPSNIGQPKTFPDVSAGSPDAGSIGQAAAWGLVSGYPDGTFHPSGDATRAEAAALLDRAMTAAGLLSTAPAKCPPMSPCGNGSDQPPAVTPFLTGYNLGVNLQGADMASGLSQQPTGTALVKLLQQAGVQIVRVSPAPNMSQLGSNPWRTILDPLQAAGIKVILTLVGDQTFRATGIISNPTSFIANEEATLTEIKSEYGGSYPSNLMAVDPINEPVVDSQTLPQLQTVTAAIRRYSGLPVTIGGWRTPGGASGNSDYNEPDPTVTAELAPLVDYLSVHIYPDLKGGSNTTSTNPATYTSFVQNFLQTATTSDGGKPVFVEEFGGQNGLASAGGRPVKGSPAHQQAVVDAVLQTIKSFQGKGVIGGTVWQMAPGPWEGCDGLALVCFDPAQTMPALGDLKEYE